MQAASSPRTAPIALWRVAEAFLHVLYNLFGAPEDVAREAVLGRTAHALLLSWLRVGEDVLRRLLAIEAAAFERSGLPPSSGHRQRARRLMEFTADHPEAWRVSFRCIVSSSPARGGSAEQREAKGDVTLLAPSDAFGVSSPTRGGDKSRFLSAWPLAERYEALLRVFNAPHVYARRLARRLHANPKLLETVLRTSEHYDHRVDDAGALTETARAAWRKPDSS